MSWRLLCHTIMIQLYKEVHVKYIWKDSWVRRSVVVLMVVLVGCGEDKPEKVKLKEVEKFKVHPHVGMALIPEGAITKGRIVNVNAFHMD